MTPLQTQFEILKESYPQALMEELPSGAVLIIISDFPVPTGWSKDNATLRFLAPVGYPFAKPDCFWVDSDFRLKNGAMPKNAQIQVIPEVDGSYSWFSWHVGHWNPNKDNLSTFVRVVINRFKEAQ